MDFTLVFIGWQTLLVSVAWKFKEASLSERLSKLKQNLESQGCTKHLFQQRKLVLASKKHKKIIWLEHQGKHKSNLSNRPG